jgi:O-antigen/teichoic acid export membrane protein
LFFPKLKYLFKTHSGLIVDRIKELLFTGSPRSILAKKHIIYSFFLQGLSIVIGLLFVPLLLDYLDAERYGIWLTLTSIVGWFTFFDAGLGNGLRNKLTAALAKGEIQLAREYVSTTYAIISVVFLSILTIFYIVNPFLDWSRILNTRNVPGNELSMLALIVFTFFFLKFIFNLIGIILMADQRPALNNAFGPIGNLLALIIIYTLTFTTKGAFVLMGFILSVLPVLILLIASVVLFYGKYSYLRPGFKCIRLEHSFPLLGLGIKFFVIQLSALILFSTSNVIISQILGAEQVTIYNIAFKYFQVPVMLFGIIMIPIWSAVTDAFIREDFGWLSRTLAKLNKTSLLFLFGIIFMLIVSPFIYKIWVGQEIKIPFMVSATMALYAIMTVFSSPYSFYINGLGKLYIVIRMVVLTSILYIPLAIFLAKTPLALAGVMLATCIVNAINIPIYVVQTNRLINKRATGIWNQ